MDFFPNLLKAGGFLFHMTTEIIPSLSPEELEELARRDSRRLRQAEFIRDLNTVSVGNTKAVERYLQLLGLGESLDIRTPENARSLPEDDLPDW